MAQMPKGNSFLSTTNKMSCRDLKMHEVDFSCQHSEWCHIMKEFEVFIPISWENCTAEGNLGLP